MDEEYDSLIQNQTWEFGFLEGALSTYWRRRIIGCKSQGSSSSDIAN
jgi:hypothetical protein